MKILDPNDPEHKHIIEKRIHHEAYEGEDLWRGMFLVFLPPHGSFLRLSMKLCEIIAKE